MPNTRTEHTPEAVEAVARAICGWTPNVKSWSGICDNPEDGQKLREFYHTQASAAIAAMQSQSADPSSEQGGEWQQVTAERAHYVDYGTNVVLCDRLPQPVTLVLKNPVWSDSPAAGPAEPAPLSREIAEWNAARDAGCSQDAAISRVRALPGDDAEQRLRMIVSHATGGNLQYDPAMSVNAICCEITAMRNKVWQHAQKALMDSLTPRPAKAIEARRAETGTGSVHESAVPQAFAQTIPGDPA